MYIDVTYIYNAFNLYGVGPLANVTQEKPNV